MVLTPDGAILLQDYNIRSETYHYSKLGIMENCYYSKHYVLLLLLSYHLQLLVELERQLVLGLSLL